MNDDFDRGLYSRLNEDRWPLRDPQGMRYSEYPVMGDCHDDNGYQEGCGYCGKRCLHERHGCGDCRRYPCCRICPFCFTGPTGPAGMTGATGATGSTGATAAVNDPQQGSCTYKIRCAGL